MISSDSRHQRPRSDPCVISRTWQSLPIDKRAINFASRDKLASKKEESSAFSAGYYRSVNGLQRRVLAAMIEGNQNRDVPLTSVRCSSSNDVGKKQLRTMV